MSYSKKTIKDMYCKEAIKYPKSFYAQPFINWAGKASDEDTYATEIVAEFLLEDNNFAWIKNISEDSRHKVKKLYNEQHKGQLPPNANHNNEKIIAIDIFNQGTFNHIGKVIDYQTPLKAKQNDKYGEIDLLAANEENKTVYMQEESFRRKIY